MKSFESIARNAYEAFSAHINSQKATPKPMPSWQELPEVAREAWIDSARVIAEEINQVH